MAEAMRLALLLAVLLGVPASSEASTPLQAHLGCVGRNLTRFHGVFAPGAKLRPFLLPQEKAEPEEKSPSFAATVEAPKKECTPRWDFRGAATQDAKRWTCGPACGGAAGFRGLADLIAACGVSAIVEHLGLPSGPAKRAPAQGPPQSAGC
jgi:hypothetical protein